jgi:hypothetical protein
MDGFLVPDQEHFLEVDCLPDLSTPALHVNQIALTHSILLSARFDNCVQGLVSPL